MVRSENSFGQRPVLGAGRSLMTGWESLKRGLSVFSSARNLRVNGDIGQAAVRRKKKSM